jgi:hypothetical protein
MSAQRRSGGCDPKAGDRRRALMIQLGLTAVIVVVAVALVIYIVM